MPNPLVTPTHAPVAQQFFSVTVSVSSSASAIAAGVGPFRGLIFRTTGSCVITQDGNNLILDAINPTPNSYGILWVQGSYLSVIASTASAIYAVR